MDDLFFILVLVAVVYFGGSTLRVLVTLLSLLRLLRRGAVKWPGPRIHDPPAGANANKGRVRLRYQQLFPSFLWHVLGVAAVFVAFLVLFLSMTPLMDDWVTIEVSLRNYIFYFIGVAVGSFNVQKARSSMGQVGIILADVKAGVEPRAVDGTSAEALYAIQHPLIGHRLLGSQQSRALDIYYESVRAHQDGQEHGALILYQEALRLAPALHQAMIDIMSEVAGDGSPAEEAAFFYWLGIHSENLSNWRQAAEWYEKAINVYRQIDYTMRQSRAHVNLGNVKTKMRDPSAMDEFREAIALNPNNGSAYLNIARTYYTLSVCEPGHFTYDLAMDAFASAIIADPQTYRPLVMSSLKEIGYTWKRDIVEIARRIEAKRAYIGHSQ
jgi:hypothetical protein